MSGRDTVCVQAEMLHPRVLAVVRKSLQKKPDPSMGVLRSWGRQPGSWSTCRGLGAQARAFPRWVSVGPHSCPTRQVSLI